MIAFLKSEMQIILAGRKTFKLGDKLVWSWTDTVILTTFNLSYNINIMRTCCACFTFQSC